MTDIRIPTHFMGIPVSDATLEKVLKGTPANSSDRKSQGSSRLINPNAKPVSGYVFVPSIGLYVAKQRTLQNSDWYECHKQLQANGEAMPTIPEFVEFLKYLRANPNGIPDSTSQEITTILDEILAVKDPWRAEWFDAKFEKRKRKMYVDYGHELQQDETLKPKYSEQLEDYLTKDKEPGINLDSWLNNPTKQGLPRPKTKEGDIWYWYPRGDAVARFGADSGGAGLYCDGSPTRSSSALGVRAVRRVAP